MADILGVPIPAEPAGSNEIMSALYKQAEAGARQYEQLAKQINKLGDSEMADAIVTPTVPMIMGNGGGDGMFGGNGMIGGLILGRLLGNNNGGLFGGDGNAGIGAVATQHGVQNVVNQSAIQQELADIKASIPFNEAQVQLALASVQNALVNQINDVSQAGAVRDVTTQSAIANGFANQSIALAGSLAAITRDVNNTQLAVERGVYANTQATQADGDKTRALIVAQYEATLNRQLSDANAQIIALQNRNTAVDAARGVEVNTTNNINQMQQQQQQQQQYSQLANLIWGLGQQIRSTNEAINVGTGTLTANPVNTNTNIR